MKKAGSAPPLKVALYGMDSRSYKTMELYLKGPCKGVAVVVSADEAETDIIDADFATAGEILETRRQQTPDRPIILLSLQLLKVENTYFVQKPVSAGQLTKVLNELKSQICELRKSHAVIERQDAGPKTHETLPAADEHMVTTGRATVSVSGDDRNAQKAAKKKVMFEDNEGGYTAFLGMLSGVDFNDKNQLLSASFDPKAYFLSFVLSAYRVAGHEKRAFQLNSIWKPLIILPDSHQVWIDADDKQLRAFAGVEQNNAFAGNINLVPVDANTVRANNAPEKFQDMDVFIWKLTILTSKGRFPLGLYPDRPVYLKHWPNFTRLLLTPDALRISALLLQGARTPLDIIRVLNARPQYVFAFISACYSLGILGKSERQIDRLIAPDPPKHSKKQGLLSKILHKLRAN
ncbi:hypothetical protein [Methylomonas sp. MgM2]